MEVRTQKEEEEEEEEERENLSGYPRTYLYITGARPYK